MCSLCQKGKVLGHAHIPHCEHRSSLAPEGPPTISMCSQCGYQKKNGCMNARLKRETATIVAACRVHRRAFSYEEAIVTQKFIGEHSLCFVFAVCQGSQMYQAKSFFLKVEPESAREPPGRPSRTTGWEPLG